VVCTTTSPVLREDHSLRVFENRVLRRIFGSKREDAAGAEASEDCISRSFLACTLHHMLLV